MSENVTPEQWARYIARDLGADFLPTQIGDSLSSTKRKADAYDALGPNPEAKVAALSGVPDPEAAVKGAREALIHAGRSIKQMADTHCMETPSSCAEIYALCAMALGMLGGGE